VAGVRRGYHKPIMSAGGMGTISASQTHKVPSRRGTLLVQLGGPGMRIGMGGGAASSMAAGANAAHLDFDSVQRGNPEIERRAQEVINHCWALGSDNPILAIHDVGAGGLSNAFPELVDGAGPGRAVRSAQQFRWKRAVLRPRRPGATRARSAMSWRWLPRLWNSSRGCAERERCPYRRRRGRR
jgi:phosphoribosylformylglycinamidine synthase